MSVDKDITQTLQRLPQWLLFGMVGAAAALTHLLVVALLVQGTGMSPPVANVLGFLVAFVVSYQGHVRLTFGQAQARGWGTVARFFAVACLGFAGNAVLYAAALRWLPLHYLWSLALVLVTVAAGTFVLSKFWAFRAQSHA